MSDTPSPSSKAVAIATLIELTGDTHPSEVRLRAAELLLASKAHADAEKLQWHLANIGKPHRPDPSDDGLTA